MLESCVQSEYFVIVILVSCNWSCGSDELDQEGTKPRTVCKEYVSSLVQKCVPERPREYEMVGFINNKMDDGVKEYKPRLIMKKLPENRTDQ
jgi:hypothetical protein